MRVYAYLSENTQCYQCRGLLLSFVIYCNTTYECKIAKVFLANKKGDSKIQAQKLRYITLLFKLYKTPENCEEFHTKVHWYNSHKIAYAVAHYVLYILSIFLIVISQNNFVELRLY